MRPEYQWKRRATGIIKLIISLGISIILSILLILIILIILSPSLVLALIIGLELIIPVKGVSLLIGITIWLNMSYVLIPLALSYIILLIWSISVIPSKLYSFEEPYNIVEIILPIVEIEKQIKNGLFIGDNRTKEMKKQKYM